MIAQLKQSQFLPIAITSNVMKNYILLFARSLIIWQLNEYEE